MLNRLTHFSSYYSTATTISGKAAADAFIPLEGYLRAKKALTCQADLDMRFHFLMRTSAGPLFRFRLRSFKLNTPCEHPIFSFRKSSALVSRNVHECVGRRFQGRIDRIPAFIYDSPT
jgi:hypothetical protein